MKRAVIYDPSVSSINLGDHIIADSARRQLAPLLEGAFEVTVSTHLPVSVMYARILLRADHRFVLGSNLLRGKMNRAFRQWDINLVTAKMLGPVALIGAGWWQYRDTLNAYTSVLYRTILDRELPQSVRDGYTEKQLRSAGLTNVINTGCPTMWELTPQHCRTIPTQRASQVVTTVTDYGKDPANDRAMLRLLSEEYSAVHVWLQGLNDDIYLRDIAADLPNVQLVAPNLAAFDRVLDAPDIEYIGTRLHAGIRALQKKRRSIVLSIDNRAMELSRDFSLTVVRRGAHDELREMLRGEFPTEVTIPTDAIHEWKRQHGLE